MNHCNIYCYISFLSAVSIIVFFQKLVNLSSLVDDLKHKEKSRLISLFTAHYYQSSCNFEVYGWMLLISYSFTSFVFIAYYLSS